MSIIGALKIQQLLLLIFGIKMVAFLLIITIIIIMSPLCSLSCVPFSRLSGFPAARRSYG